MFLNELEEILEATQVTEFELCMVPLFHQIAQCLSSSYFQVQVSSTYRFCNCYMNLTACVCLGSGTGSILMEQ